MMAPLAEVAGVIRILSCGPSVALAPVSALAGALRSACDMRAGAIALRVPEDDGRHHR